jgi:hypothetical protein
MPKTPDRREGNMTTHTEHRTTIELRKARIERALITLASRKANRYTYEVNIESAERKLQRAVKMYVRQCIDDGADIYDDLAGISNDLQLKITERADEIRAYFAAHLLCEDLSSLNLMQLHRLHRAVVQWCKKSVLLLSSPCDVGRWYRLQTTIEREIELQSMTRCEKCGEWFETSDDYENHRVYRNDRTHEIWECS